MEQETFKSLDQRMRDQGYVFYTVVNSTPRLDTPLDEKNIRLYELSKVLPFSQTEKYVLSDFDFGPNMTGPDMIAVYLRLEPRTSFRAVQPKDFLIPLEAPAGTVWYMLRANRK